MNPARIVPHPFHWYAGLEPGRKAFVKMAGCIIFLSMLVLGLGLGWYGAVHSNTASRQARSGCGFYKSIAEAPIPQGVSPLGLTILAQARVAYDTGNCTLGALAKADPRVAELLPPGVK